MALNNTFANISVIYQLAEHLLELQRVGKTFSPSPTQIQ